MIMDERELIYWLHGFLELSDSNILSDAQIDMILENIAIVNMEHDYVHDKESFRLINIFEGYLTFYNELPEESKKTITSIMRNEIEEMFAIESEMNEFAQMERDENAEKEDLKRFAPKVVPIRLDQLSQEEANKIINSLQGLLKTASATETKISEEDLDKMSDDDCLTRKGTLSEALDEMFRKKQNMNDATFRDIANSPDKAAYAVQKEAARAAS